MFPDKIWEQCRSVQKEYSRHIGGLQKCIVEEWQWLDQCHLTQTVALSTKGMRESKTEYFELTVKA